MKAKHCLKKGGILMMLIDGNPDSLVMRVLQEKCVGYEYSRLWYFSPSVIEKLLNKKGFKVLKIESIIHTIDPLINHMDYDIHIMVKGKNKMGEEDAFIDRRISKANKMGYKFKVLAKNMKSNELYIVHCVDTEGPLHEEMKATFNRLLELGVDIGLLKKRKNSF